MILQALCRYYDILERDKDVEISTVGRSPANVSFALVISRDGELTNIIDLRTDGKKPQPKVMDVPYQKSRSSNTYPYFLCDKAEYVFGVERIENGPKRKKLEDNSGIVAVLEESEKASIIVSKRSAERHERFRDLHHKLLDGIDDAPIDSFLKFLDAWKPESFMDNPKAQEYWEEILEGNLVFECDGDYLHDNKAAQRAWDEQGGSDPPDNGDMVAQCLISGLSEPIARSHQKIKGVNGSQVTGASLVSFNDAAFCSYGKEQSFNAPVSRTSETKYTTVLNFLLKRESKNRIQIDDTTIVFWAETSDRTYIDLVSFFLDPRTVKPKDDGESSDDTTVKDERTLQLMGDILKKVKNGQPVPEKEVAIDPAATNFYILGLSPNNARLAVRFWYQDSFGHFLTRVAQHHLDMEIVRDDFGPPYTSVYRLLKESVPQSSNAKAPSPLLDGLLMRAILEGTPYPLQLYGEMLDRVRVERSINYIRAGFIKAHLLRLTRSRSTNLKEELITVSLNEDSSSVPYRLGRLFAVLEKAQSDTKRDAKSTINSKYFGSAATTPAVVFPVLLKLAQHHMEKSDWGFKSNQMIEEVMSGIDRFPAYLTLEDQGMFMLGYYHQRKDFFKKRDANKKED